MNRDWEEYKWKLMNYWFIYTASLRKLYDLEVFAMTNNWYLIVLIKFLNVPVVDIPD